MRPNTRQFAKQTLELLVSNARIIIAQWERFVVVGAVFEGPADNRF
jgi:hypothetical protein